MKKMFSMLALVALSTGAIKAQSTFQKSDKFVEGMASYTSKDKKETYKVSPMIGYFVNDKIAVGAMAEFSTTDSSKTTNIGAFGRYYFLNLGKNFKIFSDLTVMSNSTKVNDEKTSGVAFGTGLGVNYFVTNRLALSTRLANLMSYDGGSSTFNIGFEGITNPINTPTFGVLYKF
jgi:outer membrane protein